MIGWEARRSYYVARLHAGTKQTFGIRYVRATASPGLRNGFFRSGSLDDLATRIKITPIAESYRLRM